MKNRLLVLLLVVFAVGSSKAQKHDYVWLSGYDSNVGYDSTQQVLYGTSVLDFNLTPRDIRYDSLKMNFDKTNTSYCDSNGNLLFYTNGIYVANSLDEIVQNSLGMNSGPLMTYFDPSIQHYGYRTTQGIFALANPTSLNQFYIFNTYVDTANIANIITTKLLYHILDISANGGHGVLLQKNISVLQDSISWETATIRHGNGKDWWIVIQKRNTNCYYIIAFNATGLHVTPTLQCGGNLIKDDDVGKFAISPDGSKLVYGSVYGGISIFDFDRCQGNLKPRHTIPSSFFIDSGLAIYGLAISPNNRFLYVGATLKVIQFDLQATNIDSSMIVIAIYDGAQNPFASYFATMQLAPDGKIYESCGNGENVYHVINRPDEKGDSCLFGQHEIHLPTFSGGVPNFPNYRLGALPGSPCDTLTGLNETARAEKEKILKVFPNPATDYVTIDYGFTDWNKGEATLEITNQLGQVVHQQPLPMYSGFQKVEVSQLATGVYTAFIKRGVQVVATAKFVKNP